MRGQHGEEKAGQGMMGQGRRVWKGLAARVGSGRGWVVLQLGELHQPLSRGRCASLCDHHCPRGSNRPELSQQACKERRRRGLQRGCLCPWPSIPGLGDSQYLSSPLTGRGKGHKPLTAVPRGICGERAAGVMQELRRLCCQQMGSDFTVSCGSGEKQPCIRACRWSRANLPRRT